MRLDSALSVRDACGRQVSLLNEQPDVRPPSQHPTAKAAEPARKRYHCTEPGCSKSFTTSGHLARHNRIHTGEKNFCCLYPGCPSRFSRQDNMMQHYRTHMSPKSRRNQKPASAASGKSHQRLPCLQRHARISSDNLSTLYPLVFEDHRASSFPYPPPSRFMTPPLALPKPILSGPTSNLPFSRHRPHRAASVSSTCSSSSSTSSCLLPSPTPSPPSPQRLPSYLPHLPPPPTQPANGEKPLSSDLLQLAHIVATFG